MSALDGRPLDIGHRGFAPGVLQYLLYMKTENGIRKNTRGFFFFSLSLNRLWNILRTLAKGMYLRSLKRSEQTRGHERLWNYYFISMWQSNYKPSQKCTILKSTCSTYNIKYLKTCSGAKAMRSSNEAQLFLSSSPCPLTKRKDH